MIPVLIFIPAGAPVWGCGDPRYAPDALPRMDCGRPPACQRGWGALGPHRAALAPPLPGTTSARTRWSTLAYVEKVRPQFLSLRQLG
jgi:hypothetical protein